MNTCWLEISLEEGDFHTDVNVTVYLFIFCRPIWRTCNFNLLLLFSCVFDTFLTFQIHVFALL